MWQSWCLRNFLYQYSILYISPPFSFCLSLPSTKVVNFPKSVSSPDLLPFEWTFLSSSLLGYLWSMFSLSRWLLGDVLNEGAEDGHLLGEAGLCALLLLYAHVLWWKVTDTVVEALLSSVEEVLSLRLEINEGTWVVALCVLFVHY
jgi:hypothetical protein